MKTRQRIGEMGKDKKEAKHGKVKWKKKQTRQDKEKMVEWEIEIHKIMKKDMDETKKSQKNYLEQNKRENVNKNTKNEWKIRKKTEEKKGYEKGSKKKGEHWELKMRRKGKEKEGQWLKVEREREENVAWHLRKWWTTSFQKYRSTNRYRLWLMSAAGLWDRCPHANLATCRREKWNV